MCKEFLPYLAILKFMMTRKVHCAILADGTNLLFGNKCPSEKNCVVNNKLKLLTD